MTKVKTVSTKAIIDLLNSLNKYVWQIGATNNPLCFPNKIALCERKKYFNFLTHDKKVQLARISGYIVIWPLKLISHFCFELLRNATSRLLLLHSQLEKCYIEKRNMVLTYQIEPRVTEGRDSLFLRDFIDYLDQNLETFQVAIPQFGIRQASRINRRAYSHILVRRDVKTSRLIILLLQNCHLSLKFLKILICIRTLTITERTFLASAAVKQLTRESMNCLIIAEELRELAKFKNCKALILPYEGHPLEITIIDKLSKRCKDLQIFAYQHAPIVAGQDSFFRGISSWSKSVIILTSGPTVRGIINARCPSVSSKVMVAGSTKNFKSSHSRIDFVSREGDFLIVPEASESDVYDLLEFLSINELNIGRQNTIRLHPRLKVSDKILKHIKFAGCNLSTRSLEDEARNHRFVVYKSSSAALEAMQSGCIPIYGSRIERSFGDPLQLLNGYQNRNKELWISENSKLWLCRGSMDKLSQISSEIGNNYFSPFDKEFLKSFL